MRILSSHKRSVRSAPSFRRILAERHWCNTETLCLFCQKCLIVSLHKRSLYGIFAVVPRLGDVDRNNDDLHLRIRKRSLQWEYACSSINVSYAVWSCSRIWKNTRNIIIKGECFFMLYEFDPQIHICKFGFEYYDHALISSYQYSIISNLYQKELSISFYNKSTSRP